MLLQPNNVWRVKAWRDDKVWLILNKAFGYKTNTSGNSYIISSTGALEITLLSDHPSIHPSTPLFRLYSSSSSSSVRKKEGSSWTCVAVSP